jgi:methylmalonyl-CoA mutase cobalamin-binding subunit
MCSAVGKSLTSLNELRFRIGRNGWRKTMKVVVAKTALDGHWRGVQVVTTDQAKTVKNKI